MGRKKMTEAEAAAIVDVRLRMDTELHSQIKEAAKRQRLTVAGFLRAAAMDRLERMAGKNKSGDQ